MTTTDWAQYGRASGNSKCQDCMVHCGYEPTAVDQTFGSLKGLWTAAKVTLFGLRPLPGDRATPPVDRSLDDRLSARPPGPLVQLDLQSVAYTGAAVEP